MALLCALQREVTLPWSLCGQTEQKKTGRTYGKTQTQCPVAGWGSGAYRENEHLVTSYLKILKNSLKLKRFKNDVFKYSSKTWKRNVTATIRWEDNLAGTGASYLHWQTLDYRHIWIIVFKPSSFQNCSLEVFVCSAETECLSSSSSTNQHIPQK